MKVRLLVTQEKFEALTVDEIITIQGAESGLADLRGLRDTIARFVVAESGAPLDIKLARAGVGGLTLKELTKVAEEFGRQMRMHAVPPVNGGFST